MRMQVLYTYDIAIVTWVSCEKLGLRGIAKIMSNLSLHPLLHTAMPVYQHVTGVCTQLLSALAFHLLLTKTPEAGTPFARYLMFLPVKTMRYNHCHNKNIRGMHYSCRVQFWHPFLPNTIVSLNRRPMQWHTLHNVWIYWPGRDGEHTSGMLFFLTDVSVGDVPCFIIRIGCIGILFSL